MFKLFVFSGPMDAISSTVVVCFDSLHPRLQLIGHVGRGLPGLKNCLAQGHNKETPPAL